MSKKSDKQNKKRKKRKKKKVALLQEELIRKSVGMTNSPLLWALD